MVSIERWKAAQRYEWSYWSMRARQIATGASAQLGWYQWRADQLVVRLRGAGLQDLADGHARIAEIGSGPIGIAGFFPAREMVLVDPLEEHYTTDPVLTAVRNPRASYRRGVGESVPADSAAFDLVIIDNCIDHVQDVDAVMREIIRILTPGGALYLSVNCRTPVGFVVHRMLSRLRLDPGHPHTFTPVLAQKLVRRHRFVIRDVQIGSAAEARRKDLHSRKRTAVVKALLGVSESPTSIIGQRLQL